MEEFDAPVSGSPSPDPRRILKDIQQPQHGWKIFSSIQQGMSRVQYRFPPFRSSAKSSSAHFYSAWSKTQSQIYHVPIFSLLEEFALSVHDANKFYLIVPRNKLSSRADRRYRGRRGLSSIIDEVQNKETDPAAEISSHVPEIVSKRLKEEMSEMECDSPPIGLAIAALSSDPDPGSESIVEQSNSINKAISKTESDSAPTGLSVVSFAPDSDPGMEYNITEKSKYINRKTLKLRTNPEPVSSGSVFSSSERDPGLGNLLGGTTEDLAQLLNEVNGLGSQLEIIAIVGMRGIGKTTLARQLYIHPLIVSSYDVRAWITISRNFDLRKSLLAILDCLGYRNDEICELNDLELGERVNKILHHKKYLVVIDDIWDKETWIKLQSFFPNDDSGSRVLLTTWKREVAEYNVLWKKYNMHPMNENASWELLCWKVFGKSSCPPELETIGKRIAKRCHGLPQAIIAISGLLSNSEKLEHWERIAMNASSMEVDLHSEFLSTSYDDLPTHLRKCFLYLGVFPEDYEIQASKLIKLWIAEGFVQQVKESVLEDIAEGYLLALIDANLLLICQKEFDGKIRTLKAHFLFREFCKKKAFEERFLWFNNLEDNSSPLCHVSVQPLIHPTNNLKLTPVLHSFFYIGHTTKRLAPLFLGLTLLRVLDVFQIEFFHFPNEILQCFNLSYLAFSCHSDLPSSISTLTNLQFLVIRRLPSFRAFSLPSDLWELTQIRYIKCKETCIWNYSESGNVTFHTNLQTLSTIQVSKVIHKLLESSQNLRRLGLFCNESVDTSINLGDMHKLEMLKCSSNLSRATHKFLSYVILPRSLRILTLRFCTIPSGLMTELGSLPILQQLKMQKCAFLGIVSIPIELPSEQKDLEAEATAPTWELKDDQFSQLISLQMEDLNLVRWKAYHSCLPMLKHLIIRGCSSMREIPVYIGEISSLKLIEVDECCSHPVIASAKEIQKVQLDRGNHILQLNIRGRQGIDNSREHEELLNLYVHEVEKKQGMKAKRKSYMKKLKERMK